jgi:hypothetical protein
MSLTIPRWPVALCIGFFAAHIDAVPQRILRARLGLEIDAQNRGSTRIGDTSKLTRRMIERIALGLLVLVALTSSGFSELLPPSGRLVQLDGIARDSTTMRLAGYLARPRAEGRPPAVVVLHSCRGISGSTIGTAEQLATWGYVALAPDSLTPRGLENACMSGLPDQARDAYAALRFLKQQSFVDPDRIAVLGFSMGGISALSDVELGVIEDEFTTDSARLSHIIRSASAAAVS